MNKRDKVIGIEIHVTLLNPKKTFSPTPCNECSWTSLGFLGTLPQINYEAVISAIKLANAFNMKINNTFIAFDRKNYFYYDLPRGYQITQFFHPIGKNGFIQLENGHKIRIKQLHLEEDTAKQVKHGHSLALTFERLGNPLVELVTEPDFRDFSEVEEFLRIFRQTCIYQNISRCEYEEGELRVDLNISCKIGESKPSEDPNVVTMPITTPKAEVKNLNSLTAISKSIDYIYQLINDNLDNKKEVASFTYMWVDKLDMCQVIRSKGDSVNYFYIPEANIPPLSITDAQLKKILNKKDTLQNFKDELLNSGLSEKECNNLLNNYQISVRARLLNEKISSWKKTYFWIAEHLQGILNNLRIENINESELIDLIVLIEKTGGISTKTAKSMMKEVIEHNLNSKDAFWKHKVELIVDPVKLELIITSILDDNKHQLDKLSKNREKLEKFVLGQAAARTSGQASPQLCAKIFSEIIDQYLAQLNIKIV